MLSGLIFDYASVCWPRRRLNELARHTASLAAHYFAHYAHMSGNTTKAGRFLSNSNASWRIFDVIRILRMPLPAITYLKRHDIFTLPGISAAIIAYHFNNYISPFTARFDLSHFALSPTEQQGYRRLKSRHDLDWHEFRSFRLEFGFITPTSATSHAERAPS